MDVVILLVFISLVLVGGGLLFFVYRLREGDFEHGDRLALKPLVDDKEVEEVFENRTSEVLVAPEEAEGTPNVES